jgi:hypothetical protein
MIAATEIGFVRMRVSKVVGLNDGDHLLTTPPMTITKAER